MSTTGGRSASAAPQSHLQGKDERAPHAARVSASQAILDRAYGKRPTFSTQDTTQFKRAIDMTDDELVAIIAQAKAKLTVVK
jgi:hypothetical protein